MERDTAIIVGFCGRGEIQIRERNLLVMLRREVQQIRSHNGVVADFFLVPVAEDQHSGRRVRLLIVALSRLDVLSRVRTACRGILLALFFLIAHANFC